MGRQASKVLYFDVKSSLHPLKIIRNRLIAKPAIVILFFVIFRCVWPFAFLFFSSHHFSLIFWFFVLVWFRFSFK